MEIPGAYIKLNVEKYGGMLCAEWFDRPLSVAGRLIVRDKKGQAQTKLVNVDKDLLMLPALAIHMNREANDGYKYNAQKDMLPIFGDDSAKDKFFEVVAKAAGVKKEDILGHDLFLYNRVKPTVWGASDEFIASSRLDDQECVYTTFEGFMNAADSDNVAVHWYLIMKRSEVVPSRARLLHSSRIHLQESMSVLAELMSSTTQLLLRAL